MLGKLYHTTKSHITPAFVPGERGESWQERYGLAHSVKSVSGILPGLIPVIIATSYINHDYTQTECGLIRNFAINS